MDVGEEGLEQMFLQDHYPYEQFELAHRPASIHLARSLKRNMRSRN